MAKGSKHVNKKVSKEKKEEVLAYLRKNTPHIDLQDAANALGVGYHVVKHILYANSIPYTRRSTAPKGYAKKREDIVAYLSTTTGEVDISDITAKFKVDRRTVKELCSTVGRDVLHNYDPKKHVKPEVYVQPALEPEEQVRVDRIKKDIVDGTYWERYPIGSVGLFQSILTSLSK